MTVPVITRPFFFEGKERNRAAWEGIETLLALKLAPIILPSERRLFFAPKTTTLMGSLQKADELLCTAVQGITDPLLRKGHICYDFADHRAVLSTPGIGTVGTGNASGPSRARDAAMQAISDPFFGDFPIGFASGVFVCITGGKDCTIEDAIEAVSVILEVTREDAIMYYTICEDESLNDGIHLSVTATGITLSETDRQPLEHFAIENIHSFQTIPAHLKALLNQKHP